MMMMMAACAGKPYTDERDGDDLVRARHEQVRARQWRRVILREFLREKSAGSDVIAAEEVVRAAGSPAPTSADHAVVFYSQ